MASKEKFNADIGLKTDADLQVDGNVTVTGDFTVNGTSTTINATTTSVEDNMLELANSNTSSDTIDIGIYGNYDDGLSDGGASEYTGLFRDASDSTWKLFDGLEEAPTTTVNTSGTGYTLADLQVGDLTATTLTATNSLTGASITYPTTDGTNGQVLTTDGSGTLSFTDMTGGVDGIVSSADATAITIDSDEQVGIGTSNPSAPLHVAGNIQTDNIYRGYDSVSGNYRNLLGYDAGNVKIQTGTGSSAYGVSIFTASTERFHVNGSGNVGIGNSSPTKGKLVVTGAAYDEGILIERTDTSSRWGLSGDDSGSFQIWDDNQGDSTRLVIDSSGKVGIGNSSPTRNLTIGDTASSSAINIKSSATNGYSILAFGDSDDDNYAQIFLDNSTNKVQIQNGGGGALDNRGITLDSSENVGIGTSNPNFKLHLKDGTSTAVYQQFTNDTTGNTSGDGTVLGIDADGDFLINNLESKTIKLFTADTERMRIDDNGRCGIGNDTPHGLLHIEDSSPIHIIGTNTGADGSTDTTCMELVGQARGYGNDISRIASIEFKTDPSTWYKGNIAFNVANSDGTNKSLTPREAMRIHSGGQITASYQPCFMCYPTSSFTASSGSVKYTFASEAHDNNNEYNHTTGRFTAPIAGRYLFMAELALESSLGALSYAGIGVRVNGSGSVYFGGWGYKADGYSNSSGTHYAKANSQVILNLAQGDYIELYIELSGSHTVLGGNNGTYTRLMGHLLTA